MNSQELYNQLSSDERFTESFPDVSAFEAALRDNAGDVHNVWGDDIPLETFQAAVADEPKKKSTPVPFSSAISTSKSVSNSFPLPNLYQDLAKRFALAGGGVPLPAVGGGGTIAKSQAELETYLKEPANWDLFYTQTGGMYRYLAGNEYRPLHNLDNFKKVMEGAYKAPEKAQAPTLLGNKSGPYPQEEILPPAPEPMIVPWPSETEDNPEQPFQLTASTENKTPNPYRTIEQGTSEQTLKNIRTQNDFLSGSWVSPDGRTIESPTEEDLGEILMSGEQWQTSKSVNVKDLGFNIDGETNVVAEDRVRGWMAGKGLREDQIEKEIDRIKSAYIKKQSEAAAEFDYRAIVLTVPAEKRADAYRQEMDKKSINRIGDMDGVSVKLKHQIDDLYAWNRWLESGKQLTPDEQKRYDDLRYAVMFEFRNTASLYDPATGRLIKKGEPKTETSTAYSKQFEMTAREMANYGTDKRKIAAIRDDAYYEYEVWKQQRLKAEEKYKLFLGQGMEAEESYKKAYEYAKLKEAESLGKYDSINLAYFTNSDPTSNIDINTNKELVMTAAAGVAESFGGNLDTAKEKARTFAQAMQEGGVELTPQQIARTENSLAEDVVYSIGAVLPDMITIGVTSAIAPEVAAIRASKMGQRIYGALGKFFGSQKFANFTGDLITQAARGYITYLPSQSGGSTGVGETVFSGFVWEKLVDSELASKWSPLLRYMGKVALGTTGETLEEFAGAYSQALAESGFDFSEAASVAFGNNLSEFERNLAVIAASSFALSGVFNLSELRKLEEVKQEVDRIAADPNTPADKRAVMESASKSLAATAKVVNEKAQKTGDMPAAPASNPPAPPTPGSQTVDLMYDNPIQDNTAKASASAESRAKEAFIGKPLGTLPVLVTDADNGIERGEKMGGIAAGYIPHNMWISSSVGDISDSTSVIGNIKSRTDNNKPVYLYFVKPDTQNGKVENTGRFDIIRNQEEETAPTSSFDDAAAQDDRIGKSLADEGYVMSEITDGLYRLHDPSKTELVGYLEVTPELVKKITDGNLGAEEATQLLFSQAGISNSEGVYIHINVNDISKYKSGPQTTDNTALIEQAKTASENIQGMYKDIFQANPEGTLFEAAVQANSSESEKAGAVSTFGQEIVDIAQKMFPDAKVGQTIEEYKAEQASTQTPSGPQNQQIKTKSESFFDTMDVVFPNDHFLGGYAATNSNGELLGRVLMTEVDDSTVKIDEVVSQRRGERTGNGSEIMRIVTENADKKGVTLTLTANLIGDMKAKGFETPKKLEAFYEKFGFVKDNKKGIMVRVPKTGPQTEEAPTKDVISTKKNEDNEHTVTLNGKEIGKIYYDSTQKAWVNSDFDKSKAEPYSYKWIYGDVLGDSKQEAIDELVRRSKESAVNNQTQEQQPSEQSDQVNFTSDSILNRFLNKLNSISPLVRNFMDPRSFVYKDNASLEFDRFDKQDKKEINIGSILSIEKNKGTGMSVMRDITDAADSLGITLTLDAKPFGNDGLNKKQLVEFYRKNGFRVDYENNFGGDFKSEQDLIDYALKYESESIPMVREPRSQNSNAASTQTLSKTIDSTSPIDYTDWYKLGETFYTPLKKLGVIWHGGSSILTKLDESKIQGGSRSELGRGFYFSSGTKAFDYGDKITFLDSSSLNLLDAEAQVPSDFFDRFQEYVNSFPEEDNSLIPKRMYYQNYLNTLKSHYDTKPSMTMRELSRFAHFEVPDVKVKHWSEILPKLGYDGMQVSGNWQVVLYPSEKLNSLIIENPVEFAASKGVEIKLPGSETAKSPDLMSDEKPVYKTRAQLFAKIADKLLQVFPNSKIVTFNRQSLDSVTFINENGVEVSVKSYLTSLVQGSSMQIKEALVKGFRIGDTVYINEDAMDTNVLVHEFAHIWENLLTADQRAYGIEMLKQFGSQYIKDVNSNPAYKNKSEEYRLREALVTAIGDMGKRMEKELGRSKFINWIKAIMDKIMSVIGVGNTYPMNPFSQFLRDAVLDMTQGEQRVQGTEDFNTMVTRSSGPTWTNNPQQILDLETTLRNQNPGASDKDIAAKMIEADLFPIGQIAEVLGFRFTSNFQDAVVTATRNEVRKNQRVLSKRMSEASDRLLTNVLSEDDLKNAVISLRADKYSDFEIYAALYSAGYGTDVIQRMCGEQYHKTIQDFLDGNKDLPIEVAAEFSADARTLKVSRSLSDLLDEVGDSPVDPAIIISYFNALFAKNSVLGNMAKLIEMLKEQMDNGEVDVENFINVADMASVFGRGLQLLRGLNNNSAGAMVEAIVAGIQEGGRDLTPAQRAEIIRAVDQYIQARKNRTEKGKELDRNIDEGTNEDRHEKELDKAQEEEMDAVVKLNTLIMKRHDPLMVERYMAAQAKSMLSPRSFVAGLVGNAENWGLSQSYPLRLMKSLIDALYQKLMPEFGSAYNTVLPKKSKSKILGSKSDNNRINPKNGRLSIAVENIRNFPNKSIVEDENGVKAIVVGKHGNVLILERAEVDPSTGKSLPFDNAHFQSGSQIIRYHGFKFGMLRLGIKVKIAAFKRSARQVWFTLRHGTLSDNQAMKHYEEVMVNINPVDEIAKSYRMLAGMFKKVSNKSMFEMTEEEFADAFDLTVKKHTNENGDIEYRLPNGKTSAAATSILSGMSAFLGLPGEAAMRMIALSGDRWAYNATYYRSMIDLALFQGITDPARIRQFILMNQRREFDETFAPTRLAEKQIFASKYVLGYKNPLIKSLIAARLKSVAAGKKLRSDYRKQSMSLLSGAGAVNVTKRAGYDVLAEAAFLISPFVTVPINVVLTAIKKVNPSVAGFTFLFYNIQLYNKYRQYKQKFHGKTLSDTERREEKKATDELFEIRKKAVQAWIDVFIANAFQILIKSMIESGAVAPPPGEDREQDAINKAAKKKPGTINISHYLRVLDGESNRYSRWREDDITFAYPNLGTFGFGLISFSVSDAMEKMFEREKSRNAPSTAKLNPLSVWAGSLFGAIDQVSLLQSYSAATGLFRELASGKSAAASENFTASLIKVMAAPIAPNFFSFLSRSEGVERDNLAQYYTGENPSDSVMMNSKPLLKAWTSLSGRMLPFMRSPLYRAAIGPLGEDLRTNVGFFEPNSTFSWVQMALDPFTLGHPVKDITDEQKKNTEIYMTLMQASSLFTEVYNQKSPLYRFLVSDMDNAMFVTQDADKYRIAMTDETFRKYLRTLGEKRRMNDDFKAAVNELRDYMYNYQVGTQNQEAFDAQFQKAMRSSFEKINKALMAAENEAMKEIAPIVIKDNEKKNITDPDQLKALENLRAFGTGNVN